MSTQLDSLARFDYLQQSDGKTVSRFWKVFVKPGRSPGYTFLFDPETQKDNWVLKVRAVFIVKCSCGAKCVEFRKNPQSYYYNGILHEAQYDFCDRV